jgi:hypothetical protein
LLLQSREPQANTQSVFVRGGDSDCSCNRESRTPQIS